MNFNIKLLLLILLSTPALFAQNSAPEITNVNAVQRTNTHLVDITFDVTDADGDMLYVVIQASADSGKTFKLPVSRLSENAGFGVLPGTGKRIVWDAGTDYPEQYGDNFQVKVVAIDGPVGKMVLVPTDTFMMGNDSTLTEFKPKHPVQVTAFYMSATEITTIQYKQFCNATGRTYPDDPAPNYFDNYPEYPVVHVAWQDAAAYCNWWSEANDLEACYNLDTGACDTSKTGYRLPTEAEWERAARDSVEEKTYPWGSDTLGADSCNYQAYNGTLVDKMAPFDNNRGPLPVGSFRATGVGLFDLAGNVSEWCSDLYDSDYYHSSPIRNPINVSSGSERCLRGGDWYQSADYIRVFHRNHKNPGSLVNAFYRGFRIVQRKR